MDLKKIIPLFIVASLFAASFTNSAHATLINSDYQLIGDGLTVTDTNTQIQWLDLSVTRYMSTNEALATYNDFRVATKEEVYSMFDSHFVDWKLDNLNSYLEVEKGSYLYDQAKAWGRLFGFTAQTATINISYGYYEGPNSTMVSDGVFFNDKGASLYGHANESIWDYKINLNAKSTDTGIFLIRTVSVPEPSVLLLLALAIIGLRMRCLFN